MANDGSVLERTKYTNKRAAAAAFAKYAAAKYNCAASSSPRATTASRRSLRWRGTIYPLR